MKPKITLAQAVGTKFVGSAFADYSNSEILLVFENGYVALEAEDYRGGLEISSSNSVDFDAYDRDSLIRAGLLSEEDLAQMEEEERLQREESKRREEEERQRALARAEKQERETYLRLKEKFEKKD